jgi:viroplasmin and RNaseH domain-containing protein
VVSTSSNLRKKNFFKIQEELIQKNKNANLEVFKLFQNVKTRWDSTCHMLIKAFTLKKILQKYHDKHEAKYLRLIETKWSQVKYFINLTKLFCIFIKTINQSKYFIIHQVFDIYDKLFDHLNQTRNKLSRKKLSWKKIMLEDLIATNTKFRQYYAKTQDSLNLLYEKVVLLFFNRKDVIFQESNWKIFNDEKSWSEIYWSAVEKQFLDEYHREFASDFRIKNSSRIDDLNLLFNVESSFKKNENEIIFYRKRDISSLLKNLIIVI